MLLPFRAFVDPVLHRDPDSMSSIVKTVLDLILVSYIAKDKVLLWQSSRFAAVHFEGQWLKDGWNADLLRFAPGVVGKLNYGVVAQTLAKCSQM